MPMQIIEVTCAIRAGYLQQHSLAPRMGIRKIGEIIDAGVYYAPEALAAILASNLFPCERSHLSHFDSTPGILRTPIQR